MKRTLITLISVLLLAALVAGTVSASAASPVLIGIPDDATNGGRAIKLLESVGLITVDPEAGWVPELKDVTGYLYNIEIVPTQANTLPATLDDFGGATINGTYAIPTGLVPSRDGLAIESQADATGDSGNPFVNVVERCCRPYRGQGQRALQDHPGSFPVRPRGPVPDREVQRSLHSRL